MRQPNQSLTGGTREELIEIYVRYLREQRRKLAEPPPARDELTEAERYERRQVIYRDPHVW